MAPPPPPPPLPPPPIGTPLPSPPPPSNWSSRNASRVVKGEIHNVLSVLRADPRYASPRRFETTYGLDDLDDDGGPLSSPAPSHRRRSRGRRRRARGRRRDDYDEEEDDDGGGRRRQREHPLVASLRELSDALSLLESARLASAVAPPPTPTKPPRPAAGPSAATTSDASAASPSSSPGGGGSTSSRFRRGGGGPSASPSSTTAQQQPTLLTDVDVVTYVAPFATAVSSREISAPATGAALSALHKFLLYGFVDPHASRGAKEGITLIARCIRHCTFEETGGGGGGGKNGAGGRGLMIGGGAAAAGGGGGGGRFLSFGRSASSSSASGGVGSSSILRSPSSAAGGAGGAGGASVINVAARVHDEEVVLKLLSLSVQVIRCPAGSLLDPVDVSGMFETCLHVAHRARDASALLRSAAGDALGHIVLVVFGRASSSSTAMANTGVAGASAPRMEVNEEGGAGDGGGGITDAKDEEEAATEEEEERMSDDSWCEADPSAYSPPRPSKGTVCVAPPPPPHAPASRPPSSGGAPAAIADPSPPPLSPSSVKSTTSTTATTAPVVTIMKRLASLVDPLRNADDTCVLALSLVNLALETGDANQLAARHPALLVVLQDDLCRHLLRLSTTTDLVVLSLALRVVFNLFDSIKDHLKVQLEVFLTSVHLRILDTNRHQHSDERREVALESLLEFTHEPALMQDLYLNYDCDMRCTNLFEAICVTLAKVASPDDDHDIHGSGGKSGEVENDDVSEEGDDEPYEPPRINVLNRLALDGLLSVIDSISRRCARPSSARPGMTSRASSFTEEPSGDAMASGAAADNAASTSSTTSLASTPPMSSDVDDQSTTSFGTEESSDAESSFCGGNTGRDDDDWLHRARMKTARVLAERKRKKHMLAQAAAEFNDRPLGKEWVLAAEQIGVLPTPATPWSVASFLHSTPKLDKTKIGLYLSKGPKEKYPFHAEVLKDFVGLFDFSGMEFSAALRSFLLRFRLPGEAQCIDRLMEAFAARLYEQQVAAEKERWDAWRLEKEKARLDHQQKQQRQHEQQRHSAAAASCSSISSCGAASDGALDPPTSIGVIGSEAASSLDGDDRSRNREEEDAADVDDCGELGPPPNLSPFRSADAVFILSFSTIMLNTDLHNPTIKDERRMTVEQFVRNNRGINDGEDLPVAFLADLYDQIKNEEIQVQKELSDVMQGDGGGGSGALQWDGVLSKSSEVATAFFTPSDTARRTFFQAGVHERDMFLSISAPAIRCISSIFVRSWDDTLVVKSLHGFQQMAKICIYFQLDETYNEILDILLGFGRDYVLSVTSITYSGYSHIDGVGKTLDFGGSRGGTDHENIYDHDEDDNSLDDYAPLPTALLSSNYSSTAKTTSIYWHRTPDEAVGSAAHRGLLSLDCAFNMLRTQVNHVREAWPTLIECIFALRDASALPVGMADLDDFADSRGTVLPPSVFARRSQHRVDDYMTSISAPDELDEGGFWSTLFKKDQPSSANDDSPDAYDLVDTIEDEFADSTRNFRTGPRSESNPFSDALFSVTKSAQLDQVIMRTRDLSATKQILHALLDSLGPDLPGLASDSTKATDPLFEHHAVFALELAARALITNRVRASELYPMFQSKFEWVFSFQREKSDESTQSNGVLRLPYLMERVAVTILRSCIHLYDMPEMHQYLKKSLELLSNLPSNYCRYVSDRLGCGLAIILRGCYAQFDKENDWDLVGNLLEKAASSRAGRGFVFDGIASCVDFALAFPLESLVSGSFLNPTGGEFERVGISFEGGNVLFRILVKFVFGSYEGDLSMCVPAMLCLEKMYWFIYHISLDRSAVDENNKQMNEAVPDEDMWQVAVSAFFSVCLSSDVDTARQGHECLQRFLLTTKLGSVSDAKWLDVLDTISSKQPPLEMDTTRIKACTLLGKMLLLLVPELSTRKENWDTLTEIVQRMAFIVGENLKAGRRGSVSPLFESTVQTVTNLSNVMSLPEFDKGGGFCIWVGETLLVELEKVGASGGAAPMLAATRRKGAPAPL